MDFLCLWPIKQMKPNLSVANMYSSHDIINEGTLMCYIQVPHKRKPEPKQRYVAVANTLRVPPTHNNPVPDSEFDCTVYFYKDKHNVQLGNVKETIRIIPNIFCGLEYGSIMIGDDKHGSYLNIICLDKTIKLQTSTSGKFKEACLETWRDMIGKHMKTKKTFTLRSSHVTCSHLPLDQQTSKVLLCVTEHAISLCSQQTHLCLKRWDLQTFSISTHVDYTCQQPDSPNEESAERLGHTLRITFAPISNDDTGEILSFKSRRAQQIVETIKELELSSEYINNVPVRPTSIGNEYIHTILCEFNMFYEQQRPKSNDEFEEMDAFLNGEIYNMDLNSLARDHRTDVAKTLQQQMGNRRQSWGGTSTQRLDHVRRNRPPSSPSAASQLWNFPPTPDEELTVYVRETRSENSSSHGGSISRNACCWDGNMADTVWQTLHNIPPDPDTLQLGVYKRRELCFRLYSTSDLPSIGDWEILGEHLGLKAEALSLIKAVILNHRIPECAAEIVLRHWQFAFNKYGTDQDQCRWPCTQEELLNLLNIMERYDLVEFMQPLEHNDSISTRL